MRFVWWMCLCILLWMGVGQAMDVRVMWDPNGETDIARYIVHWGTAPNQYAWSRDVGLSTRCDLDDLDNNVRYYISVTAVDFWGNESPYSKPVVAASGELPPVPEDFTLSENYPNPFYPSTRQTFFDFSVPESKNISISVYNLLGQKIADLVKGDFTPGPYRTRWDGLDYNGQLVPAGLYFCILTAGDLTIRRTITLIR